MNTPNPLHPQGTFPNNRGRSHFRIAFFTVVALHVVFCGVLLLMQGCKRNNLESQPPDLTATSNVTPIEPLVPTSIPPIVTSVPPAVVPTNPLPPVPPVAPSAEGEKEHVVAKGDSFYTLGKKYGVSMKAIADANPGVDSARMKIGQKLKIPAPTKAPPGTAPLREGSTGPATATGAEKQYVVKSQDTLTKIAKAHGVKLSALRKANNLKTDRLTVGQKLTIPAKAAAETTTPTTTPPLPTSTPGLPAATGTTF